MPIGATVGTSSSRRELFLRNIRSDLNILPLRGNVTTRIAAFNEGKFDAIILAAAGLERLGVDSSLYTMLPIEEFIPAACQGVIGLQTRKDWQYGELVAKSGDQETTVTTRCERKFLQYFNADCKTPIAAYAQISGDKLHFMGMLIDKSGNPVIKSASGMIGSAEELAIEVALEIKKCTS